MITQYCHTRNGDSYAAVERGAGRGREIIISFGVALRNQAFQHKNLENPVHVFVNDPHLQNHMLSITKCAQSNAPGYGDIATSMILMWQWTLYVVALSTLFVVLVHRGAALIIEDAMVETLRLSLTITCAIILLQNPTANKAKYRSLG